MTYTDAEILAAARIDRAMHLRNCVSLNPYSTAGARSEWAHGYAGTPHPYQPVTTTAYRRGQAARQLATMDAVCAQ